MTIFQMKNFDTFQMKNFDPFQMKKLDTFQMKIFDIFRVFAKNVDNEWSLKLPGGFNE